MATSLHAPYSDVPIFRRQSAAGYLFQSWIVFMPAWSDVYDEVTDTIAEFDADVLFFRGHSDATWHLLPSLARGVSHQGVDLEKIAYYDFVTRAGDLIKESASSWSTLLSMQHHGVPTRLLDWSETFAVALYFALRGAEADAAVWILDPFGLNGKTLDWRTLPRPTQLDGEYEEFFIEDDKPFPASAVAISPLRHNPRIHRQRGGFTLHRDLTIPLEDSHANVLRRVVVPVSVHDEAWAFLKFAGVSEFALFPDLDGLSRELRREHFPDF